MTALATPEMRKALDEALRSRFYSFARKTFGVVSPEAPFMPNWHVEAMAYALEKVARGETRRLLITVPPRSAKSILASVALPAWVLGQDPTQRIVCASYASDLALKFSRDTRSVMQTPWYRDLYPGTRLSPDKNTQSEFMTTAHGERLATSVDGSVTGRGGNLIIVDDPMKPAEAMSESVRRRTIEWFDGTLMSRLNDKENGRVVVVAQRLAVEDLPGHLLAKGGWTHLNLAAIAQHDEEIALDLFRTHRRQQGEALHPARESLATLERVKADLGSYMFSAQYLQEPIPAEGADVKMAWFRTYSETPAMQDRDRIVQSWDTALSADSGDYSACTTWLVRGKHYYLLNVTRKQLDFPTLHHFIVAHYRRYNANTLLIENAGSGKSMVQVMRANPRDPQPIPVNADKDKRARLATAAPTIEQGSVFLPQDAPWLADFRSELLQFPNGRYDDQVDSMSQFLNWERARSHDHVSGSSEGSKLIEFDPMPGARDPDIVDLNDDDGANDGYGAY